MNLFCQACNEIHEFSPIELEGVVYALQAQLSDTLTEDHNRSDLADHYAQFKTDEFGVGFFCLKSYHGGEMQDCEAYGEWANETIDARRRLSNVACCENCCEDAPIPTDGKVPLCELCQKAHDFHHGVLP